MVQDKFAVDMSTGDIRLKSSLDREQQASYELVVAAMDTGTPRLTGTGTVVVHVNDVNDHSPLFDSVRYVAKVAENAPAGSSVARVRATDADDGLNAVVVYSLLDDHDGKFAIDEDDGTVTTRSALDREQAEEYVLTVAASDSSPSERRTSFANLTVVVEDVNDNAPQFVCDTAVVRIADPVSPGAC